MKIDSPNILNELTVSGSVEISGSLNIVGSIAATTFVGAVQSSETGSLLLSASISNSTLTFTKGDSSTFNLTVDNIENALSASYVQFSNIDSVPALVSGSGQITYSGIDSIPVGIVSGSIQILLQDTTGNLSGSRIDGAVITANTASYIEFTNVDNVPNFVLDNEFNSYTGSTDLTLQSLQTESGSIRNAFNTFTGSTDLTLQSLQTESGSIRTTFNSYTGSTNLILDSLQTESGSIRNAFNVFTGSTDLTLQSLQTESGSIRSTFNAFTGSTDQRLDSLQTYSSSLKTAFSLDGANVTVLGNLEVAGTTTTVDSTTVDIGTNIIDLNGTGAVLAGLRVNDVTSPNTISGSFLWNSTTDRWIAGPSGSESNVLLASGDGVVSGSSQVSFSGIADKPSLISGSIQVDHDATTNFVANEHIDHSTVSISAGSGITGGGNLTATRTLTLDTGSAHFTDGVKTKLNTDGVVSGSAQVALNTATGTLDVNKGGTGQTSYTDGELLIGNTTGNTLTKGTLTAGTGITVTNGNGSITVSTVTIPSASVSGSGLVTTDDQTFAGNKTFTNSVAANSLSANGSISLYTSLIGSPSSAVIEYIVTVVTKTSNHRYFGIGSSLGYHINGIESPFLTLLPGKTYRFLQDAASNDSHQLRFYLQADKTTQFTTDVTFVGTAGNAGAYTQIVVTDTTPIVLHYQCVNHAYMGNAGQFNSNAIQVALNSATGTLDVNKGGTGQTSYTNGQLLIGNTTGNTLAKATLTGTSNQVVVTNGTGSVTLSTPQNLDTSANFRIGSLGVGTTASGVTGEIRATNEVTAFFSDDRLKNRIDKIGNALEKVNQLNGYYFVENDLAKSLGYTNDKVQVGVSAQEVQAVLPEVVVPAPIDDKYLTVKYDKLIPLLIEAIKEQDVVVKQLISDIKVLKDNLETRGN